MGGPQRRLLGFASVGAAVWLLIVACSLGLVLVSALGNRSGLLTRPLQVVVYVALPLVLIPVLLVAASRGPTRRVRSGLVVAGILAGIYAAEAALPDPSVRRLIREETAGRAKAAHDAGVPYDQRTSLEVVRAFRQQGEQAVPAIVPQNFLNETASAGFSADPVRFPLSGIANRTTVGCNESGMRMIYRSDEFGFNNPAGTWARPADAVLLGDSFVQGACVEPGRNIAGWMSAQGMRVLNLGLGGSGPLIMLGQLKEYVRELRPPNVVWFFFEGNDLLDIASERRSTELLRYLEARSTQGLRDHQPEIDKALLRVADGLLERDDETMQGEARSGFARVLRLSALRERLLTPRQPARPNLVDLRRILTEAKAEVARWGGQLHFVYLPEYGRYKKPAQPMRFRQDVLSIVDELGIHLIDVHPAFERTPDPLALFPYRLRGHYTEAGYRVVADTVDAALRHQSAS